MRKREERRKKVCFCIVLYCFVGVDVIYKFNVFVVSLRRIESEIEKKKKK